MEKIAIIIVVLLLPVAYKALKLVKAYWKLCKLKHK